ncbi:glycosyltransferase [Marinobacter confluentis]|uniref:Glycosyltransferase n=1 Tax=Marinobacter confluentis TaxID=1697557 RepID=A0A4Z1C2K0_9GAMM|nr:glycosyltransferase [Marinobacter confluentis]TGN40351.1 glycosyltransferase [Marinobacter confluentis]
MKQPTPLKLLFYVNLAIVILLIGYKLYLNLYQPDFQALHTEQVDQIEARLSDGDGFSFAVVGNINNSVRVFEDQIIPELNQAGLDFMVSAGNAVSGGGEDKYRAIQGTLSNLTIPYLLTFGENEEENFGAFRFYEHFGPHFYSVNTARARLIFLDSTGKTPWRWQMRWLRDLMDEKEDKPTFVFVGHPVLDPSEEAPFEQSEDFLQPPEFKEALLKLARDRGINAVFSANLSLYSDQVSDATHFIATGGAGGLVLNDDTSFYHYVRVDVAGDGTVSYSMKPMEARSNAILSTLESLWFFVYSLFYVGYVNFFLLVGLFALIGTKLYAAIFVEKNYYPDYDLDPKPWLDRPLRIAMFTNNYLPFIGGVPLSIERLRQGLQTLHDSVLIVAPRYRDQPKHEDNVLRVPSLLAMGEKREFRLANIFLKRIRNRVRIFQPALIHVHHPFWLGSLGLFLGRVLRVPVIYTYHTRLEHYAHFVPLPGNLFRNLISHALIKRFANKCDGVIVPTYSTEEYLRMIGVKSPTFVQPTGIEYQRFQAVSDEDVQRLRESLNIGDETVFVSVSRLSNEKNIDFMIDAIHSLRQRTDHPFRFLMIGKGHQQERLQQRIDELDLGQHFTLVGPVPPEDMATWYHLGDAFLFASKSETQGMVILEAMAAGLPVVAVRSSGIEDVVRQDFNGFKTPEKQDQWCDRVQQLLEDEALRSRLAKNALAFAADYSVEQFAADVREIYALTLARADSERKR